MQKGKRVVNPIIDWEDEDVWEYIKSRNIEYCKLYNEGYTRLGCIGCPLASKRFRDMDFERYPKFKENYKRAVDRFFIRYLTRRIEKGEKPFKNSSQEMFDWWIDDEDLDYSDSFLDDDYDA